MAAVTSRVGRIAVQNTALFICDMQEKFSRNVKYFPQIVTNTKKILEAAKIMHIPTLYTEQYPKGLGPTVPELNISSYTDKKFEKTQFSMLVPAVKNHLQIELFAVKSVILCGIEAHACIRHTAMDLIEAGMDVHVVVDASSSRNPVDRKYAFKAIENMGGHLITTESIILGLAPDASHPKFRELQKLVMELSSDTEL